MVKVSEVFFFFHTKHFCFTLYVRNVEQFFKGFIVLYVTGTLKRFCINIDKLDKS